MSLACRRLVPTLLLVCLLAAPARGGWIPGGVPVCLSGAVDYPHMAPDGAGGAWVAWRDSRDYASTREDIYLQHLTASGDVALGWPPNGRGVCTAPGDQFGGGLIVPDGQGGQIVIWADPRNASTNGADVYAQRFTAAGTLAPGWPVDGLPVCAPNADQAPLSAVADGQGGAYVA